MSIRFIPNELFERFRNDPILSNCFDTWRAGHCSLEQAIVAALLSLSRQNEEYRSKIFELMKLQPPQPMIFEKAVIIIDDKENR